MASFTFFMASVSVSPWVWHPGRAGTIATYPPVSSSRSTTPNSCIRFRHDVWRAMVDIRILLSLRVELGESVWKGWKSFLGSIIASEDRLDVDGVWLWLCFGCFF
jgi:hypothetical protein